MSLLHVVAKHGPIGLTRAPAGDHAKHQLRVNAPAPGYFLTDVTLDFLWQRSGQIDAASRSPAPSC
jgi:NAD(P)-dependent dehydrogenase (short-subunit alcohol dehydrogenase family)